MKLPNSTIVNKFIAKEKFYNKLDLNTKQKQLFVDKIEKITWLNKISSETLNISSGNYIELHIFELILKDDDFDIELLKIIDSAIPYPIIFILNDGDRQKAALAYKPTGKVKPADLIYFTTSWQGNIDLQLEGLSVDAIYKNYLKHIAPELKMESYPKLSVAIDSYKTRMQLQNQIEALNKKIRNEPSIAKRQTLATERITLEKQAKEI